jgi:ribosomal protein S18 acetylase RimI-like enzyme
MTTKRTQEKPHITIRTATLSDHIHIGRIASETYYSTPLTRFLSPHAEKHYSHYVQGFTQRALKRMLSPRNLTFVAVDDALGIPIGHLQSERLGSDEHAQKQIRSRRYFGLLWVLNMLFTAWCLLVDLMVGEDKSSDPEALRLFLKWGEEQNAEYWEKDGRRERWHVQSCVVRTEYQGMGIGKRLMREVLKRAQGEGVVVGLEASEEGEWMYRSVGFKLLGRFEQGEYEEVLGRGWGIMMWTPEGWEGEGKEVAT